MSWFWCTGRSKSGHVVHAMFGSVEAEDRETAEGLYWFAVRHPDKDASVVVESLPYPASPVLFRGESECPPFCYRPQQCKGKTCCPNNPSCCS